ncbi:MAG: hypothetical protein IJW82_03930 [Clostridia bacterium]|nr:hypothetical protein [Clostridia bacterium]
MNNRYNLINQKLKEWKKQGQDQNILKTIFEHSNLDSMVTINGKNDVFVDTGFQGLSLQELYKLFDKGSFNKMDQYQITNLFQEVHNRYITSNDLELSRNVVFDEDNFNNFWGYVTYSDNMLFMNKSILEKVLSKNKKNSKINKENVGLAFLNIILHESRHLVQYDSFLKFLLDEPMSEEQKFLGAIAGLNNINFNIANSNYDYKYTPNWNAMYDYQYLEHDAYYTGLKLTREFADKLYGNDKSYHKLLTSLSDKLGKTSSIIPTNQLKVDYQVKHVEKFLNEQIKYFKSGATDCELKSKILETVESFMEVDENGNSKLRDKLMREITEMRECYDASKKIVKSKETISFQN